MRSMTGYGKFGLSTNNLEITTEIRSVNSRYLDIIIKLPNSLAVFEIPLRDKIRNEVNRGKITVTLNVKRLINNNTDIGIDQAKFLEKYNLLSGIRDSLHLDDQITLDHLLSFPELFELDFESLDEKELQHLIHESLQKSLEAFNTMRAQEGRHLMEDLRTRITTIAGLVTEVEQRSRLNVRSEFDRLVNNVKNLISDKKIDKDRLEQEIAIISDKVDITEECVRLHSHIKLFRETLSIEGEVGKKFSFILQEMLRETNTINSKTTDAQVAHQVIQIKEEIEKLREQAQNLE